MCVQRGGGGGVCVKGASRSRFVGIKVFFSAHPSHTSLSVKPCAMFTTSSIIIRWPVHCAINELHPNPASDQQTCGVVLDLEGRRIWIRSERCGRRVCAPSDLWERPGVRRASSEYGRARRERRRLPHRSFFKASEWEVGILFDSLLTTLICSSSANKQPSTL